MDEDGVQLNSYEVSNVALSGHKPLLNKHFNTRSPGKIPKLVMSSFSQQHMYFFKAVEQWKSIRNNVSISNFQIVVPCPVKLGMKSFEEF